MPCLFKDFADGTFCDTRNPKNINMLVLHEMAYQLVAICHLKYGVALPQQYKIQTRRSFQPIGF